MSENLPSTADIVVIGGGIIGLSCALRLKNAGVGQVVVVERDTFGAGSTSKAAGGARTSYSNVANAKMGQFGLLEFERFEELYGQHVGFRRDGYLYMVWSEEALQGFQQVHELQESIGSRSEMLTAEQALELCPPVSPEGLAGALWSFEDGHAAPESVVYGYAGACRRAGVKLFQHVTVEAIDVQAGVIRTVRTTAGTIATPTVVCAAGAWSNSVGEMIGVDLPVKPYRRPVFISEPMSNLPGSLPTVIDVGTGFAFHAEGPGLAMFHVTNDEPSTFDTTFRREDDLVRLVDGLGHRYPWLTDIGIRGGWAGLYEETPDRQQLIGVSREVTQFIYATGYSGHGFQMGPATGEIVRDLYLGAEPMIDIAEFSVDRFRTGAVSTERLTGL